MKILRLGIVLVVIALILMLAVVSVGKLMRRQSISEPVSLNTTPARINSPDSQRFQLDAAQSKFIAHAMAGGLFWFKGHDHLVAVRDFSGAAQLTPDQINPASLEITAKSGSMVETSSVFTEAQKQIIDKELREIVLQPDQFPEIIFRSTQVQGRKLAEDQYDLKIAGDLTLHGVTRPITIPAKITVSGNQLRAVGEFSIDRGDFKIKATSAFHGLVQVRDTIKFNFDIVGHRI